MLLLAPYLHGRAARSEIELGSLFVETRHDLSPSPSLSCCCRSPSPSSHHAHTHLHLAVATRHTSLSFSLSPTRPPPSPTFIHTYTPSSSLPHPSTVALVQRRRPSFGGLCSHSFSVTTLIVVSLSPISPCIHSLCCSSTFHLTRAPRPSPATSRQCIWSISTPSILRTRSLHYHHHHGSPPASHPRPRLPW